jgi:glycosyltransferase involved in cell wall biosynthesis
MRIGVNCFLLQSHVGGVKQYFLTLFNWLLESDLDNSYVLFYFEHNLTELGKLKSDRWRSDARLLSNQDQIADYLSDIDLYFCPFNSLWPRPVSIPSVVMLVDIQEEFYPQFFTAEDLYYRDYHYPASTRAADRVLTISDFSKASIVRYHGVRKSKVIVAHLSADPLYFEAPAIAMPPDVKVPFSQFLFFPANCWPHKNHDTLLRALKLLKALGECANVVLTGFDIPGGYSVQAKMVEYGISECVHLAGYVTVPQMAYLYKAAEMTVFPSLFEGFGIPPVEAMAVGCPVVAAASSCLPEICGDAAEYFEPSDPVALARAICRVRGDGKLREGMIRRGHVRAIHFSVESTARAHLRAFAEAASSHSGLRFGWHRYFHEPLHKWLAGRKRALGIFEAKRLGVSWPKRESAEWVRRVLKLCSVPLRKYRLRGLSEEVRLLEASGLFHPGGAGDYLVASAPQGLDPNPLFSSRWYLQNNPDVAAAGIDPLVHFLRYGAKENRDPHPLFDVSWYLEQYPDVVACGLNPFVHYVLYGAAEGRNPHPFFDSRFYLAAVPDYNEARLNPLAHYLAQVPALAKNPHPHFDGAWYLRQNPDVAEAGFNPLMHYVTYGRFEGRPTSYAATRPIPIPMT